jgi:hypothetical protein
MSLKTQDLVVMFMVVMFNCSIHIRQFSLNDIPGIYMRYRQTLAQRRSNVAVLAKKSTTLTSDSTSDSSFKKQVNRLITVLSVDLNSINTSINNLIENAAITKKMKLIKLLEQAKMIKRTGPD